MSTPRTIDAYLKQLRAALHGADPALIQDALYDAEEHLRAELAEQPDRNEADMLATVTCSYGAPEEVAGIYRDQEVIIERALRPPPSTPRRSWAGRFFGVVLEARTYGALFYLLLSFATGIIYFAWTTTGLTLSVSLAIFIIGLPFIVLFIGSVRALSLLEGRIVEAMLDVRMPRRPPYPTPERTLMKRIKAMFTDPRTWTALAYLMLMYPLGTIYFTMTVTLLAVSIALVAMPITMLFFHSWLAGWYVHHVILVDWGFGPHTPGIGEGVAMFVIGVLLAFGTLHLVRLLGTLHARLARHLLVRSAPV
ncbi:MAG TPA: sensor domain-containing protein [Rhodanobacteraceae bacterium]